MNLYRKLNFLAMLGVYCLVAAIAGLTVLREPLRAESPTEGNFQAGAAKSNITPPLGLSIAGGMRDWKGDRVHDELWVRCLALDDGEDRLAFAICDSCMIPREIFDEAKKRASEKTGLSPENILMSSTHTHSAPASAHVFQSLPDPAYLEFLTQRIADGICRAVSNLEPAQIGWGSQDEPGEVFNRRWFMKEGTIPPNPFGKSDEKVRMNPPRASEHLVKPSGPTDPEVSVLAVRSRDGKPIAALANYSLHYVGGNDAQVSADYFGMFAEKIETLLGAEHLSPPFVGMMTNGTSGNINNIDFSKPDEPKKPYEQMNHVSTVVAAAAKAAIEKIEYRDWVDLKSAQTEISLGVRKPSAEEVAEAEKIVAGAKNPYMETMPEIYARETLFMKDYPETASLILQSFRIGDLAIAAIPCEVFVEIGLEIKEKTPFADAFTIELANGYNGYLPTPQHHEWGGYETWRAKSSYLETEASPKITEAVLSLMKDLKRSGS